MRRGQSIKERLVRSRSKVKMRQRRGVSEVIAILLLVVIVVSAAVIVLSFGKGVIGELESGGVASPVTAGGQMLVPGSRSSFAVLTLTLRNSDNRPIDSISVTNATGWAVGSNSVSGVSTGATPTTVLEAPATWTANQFVGEYLEFTSGPAKGQFLQITSNTGNTITTGGPFSPAPSPGGGDSFVVVNSIAMKYQGVALPPSACPCTALPLEATAVGSNTINTAAAGGQYVSGDTYTFLLTIIFAGGSVQTIDVEVTASN